MPSLPTLGYERAAWAQARLLVGVDEAGRGPLAGPVVAAAVVFPAGAVFPPGLRDSKTLSPARRESLATEVRRSALLIGVGAASCREIDRLNIRIATAIAMRRAVARVVSALRQPAQVLLDGLPMPELGYGHEALVDGDAHCVSISAASIIAKTVRDGLMRRLAARHPSYGWETNMGYGTAAHLAALHARGACAHHRRSFAPVQAELAL